MKKLIALLAAGTMMLGATANALVLEQDFFNYNHMLVDANMQYIQNMPAKNANDSACIPGEASVYNGEVIISGVDSDYGVGGGQAPFLSKVLATTTVTPSDEEGGEDVVTTTYNDKGTGTTIVSFDAKTSGNNGWHPDSIGAKYVTLYTGDDESGFKEVVKLMVAARPYDFRVVEDSGVVRVYADYQTYKNFTGLSIFSNSVKGNVGIALDHDNETVRLLANGKEIENGVPYALTGMLKDVPITKIEMSFAGNSVSGVTMLDNFKVENIATVNEETVVTTILDENFDDDSKKLLKDFGFNDGLSYFYRTDSAVGVVSESKKGFVIEKSIDTLPATGKAVIEFSLNAYDEEGNNVPWVGLYGTVGNDKPIFAIGNKSMSEDGKTVLGYEKIAGFTSYNYGTREQAERVNIFGATGEENSNGIISMTTVPKGTTWADVNDIRVVLDMDAETYNVYYKDLTDEYVLFNAERDIPFAEGTVGTFNKIWWAADSNGAKAVEYTISDLKIYTMTSDKPTPVVYEGTTLKTDIVPGDEVTVYAPMYADYEYAAMVIAAYDIEGRMVSCKVNEFYDVMLGYQLLKDTYTMPEGAVSMNVFFWTDMYDLIPYSTPAFLTAPVVEAPVE